AAGGRRAPLSAAQDREGQRQPAARAGVGGGIVMSAASAGAAPATRSSQPSDRGVAVVTGGSTGIGRAICEDLLAQGFEVVSLARRRCDIDHPRLHSIEVDLMDRQATAE